MLNIIIEAIIPEKDVDGFSSENVGKLMQNKALFKSMHPKRCYGNVGIFKL